MNRRTGILLTLLAFLTMVLLGFTDNLKGPLIPQWQRFYGIGYSRVGFLFFFSTLGYLLTTYWGGLFSEKAGHKGILLAGLGLVSLALVFFSQAAAFPLFAALQFLLAMGFGFIDIGLNTLGARIFVKRPALMMNWLHLFFGVGSTLGPAYGGIMLAGGFSWQGVYRGVLFLILPLVIMTLLMTFPRKGPGREGDPPGGGSPRRGSRDTQGRGIPERRGPAYGGRILLFMLLLGLGEVMEIGTATWMVSFLRDVRGFSTETAARYLSSFFLAFTLGRGAAGAVPDYWGYRSSLILFALGGLLCLGSGILLPEFTVLLPAAGFFASIMFPTVMAMVMRAFPEGQVGSAMGGVISVGGLFNMTLLWIIGIVGDQAGIFWGYSLILGAPVLMIFLLLGIPEKRDVAKRGAPPL